MKSKVLFVLAGLLLLLVAISCTPYDPGYTVITDTNNNFVVVDDIGGLVAIDATHHEVHEGEHYTYSYADADWDIAEPVEILIVTTPGYYPHLLFNIQAALDTNVRGYENATHTANAQLNAFNNNRTSANIAQTTLWTHNNDGVDGTLLYEAQFGISTGVGATSIISGGATRGDNEWILNDTVNYLLIVTTGTDDSVLDIKLSWYEVEE